MVAPVGAIVLESSYQWVENIYTIIINTLVYFPWEQTSPNNISPEIITLATF